MENNPTYNLRPANAADLKTIQGLIREARLNILGLDWRRFRVAIDQDGRVIGCGQIKPHRDGSRELASIVVEESWQERGVASVIIRNLITNEEQDLWLMCRSGLVNFYQRFGFREIFEPGDMPLYFKRIKRLWLVLVKFSKGQRRLSVMKREAEIVTAIREELVP